MAFFKKIMTAALLLAATIAPAKAALYTTSGVIGGNNVAASADVQVSGSNFTIALKNISSTNMLEAPTNTLTGLAFKFAGGPVALTPASATSPSAIFGSTFCNINACGGTSVNVGAEVGYQQFLTLAGLGITGAQVIGSAGYVTTGIVGNLGNFGGVNLESPVSLNGIEFGIVSNAAGPFNGGLSNQALIRDTLVLVLSGNLAGADLATLSVDFLYGTAPEASLHGVFQNGGNQNVPEPISAALLGVGLVGLAAVRRRSA